MQIPSFSLPSFSLPSIPFPDLSGSKKIFLLAGGGLLLVLIIVALIVGTLFKNVGPTTITMWGLWEPEAMVQVAIDDYKRAHPNVTVKYQKQSPINYRERALTAMAGGGGPDVVLIHNSWLPMFRTSLAPASTNTYSKSSFATAFYPVAVADLTAGGTVYAVPLEIDDLAMYVNQDIFTAAGAAIPTSWQGSGGFEEVASRLTVRDSAGKIKTAGAAVGTASNVDHWQDILSLMMVQAGVDLNNNSNSETAVAALSFYSGLATTDRVWDETLDNSTLAFGQGKVGMYFGPSWRFFDIKAINPNLNFKVVPVPQLSGGKVANFASYWAAGVSKKSNSSAASWQFLQFLTSEAELAKLYGEEAKLRAFGEPYPRPKMAGLLTEDPNVEPFVAAAPSAESWYLASFTADGDTGINSRIGKYYQDAVNSMLRGNDAKTALDTVAKGVEQVLGQYGVNGAGK